MLTHWSYVFLALTHQFDRCSCKILYHLVVDGEPQEDQTPLQWLWLAHPLSSCLWAWWSTDDLSGEVTVAGIDWLQNVTVALSILVQGSPLMTMLLVYTQHRSPGKKGLSIKDMILQVLHFYENIVRAFTYENTFLSMISAQNCCCRYLSFLSIISYVKWWHHNVYSGVPINRGVRYNRVGWHISQNH